MFALAGLATLRCAPTDGVSGSELALVSGSGANFAVDDPLRAPRTQWWRDARFGMFIHFGAYSQLEGEYTRPDGTLCQDAEWIQRDCQIPRDVYEKIAGAFNPAAFDAAAIADAALRAGQKYIVLTAKHHDGYAMWPTRVNDWNLHDHSAFDKRRDIIRELKIAAEARGLELGLYYSIWDWHDPDFPDESTFPRYRERMYAQLAELVELYDPAVLWFDGEWAADRPNNPWTVSDGDDLDTYVRTIAPRAIVNNRVGKRRVVDGDTGTPEQVIPDAPVPAELWESCMTLNNSWGYAKWDTNWKDSRELIRDLASIAARGGNFLLNVGPDSQGRLPTESSVRLEQMGAWLSIDGAAVHGAQAPGIVSQPTWGAVSRRGDQLYVSIYTWPSPGTSLILQKTTAFDVLGARWIGRSDWVSVRDLGDALEITLPNKTGDDVAEVIELTTRMAAAVGPAIGLGLEAQLWSNPTFSGSPNVTRLDGTINYNWKFFGSPSPDITSNAFSSRWRGEIEAPYSETYTFLTVSDDAVRLWVDGQLIIDDSSPHDPTVDQGTITLQAGRHYAIQLEHVKESGEASMKLLWSSPSIPQQIVPQNRLY